MTDMECTICKRNDLMCCEVTMLKNKIVCDMCAISMKELVKSK